MTVEELICRLEKYPADMEVGVQNKHWIYPIGRVCKVYADMNNNDFDGSAESLDEVLSNHPELTEDDIGHWEEVVGLF